jgi:hypothetical protein
MKQLLIITLSLILFVLGFALQSNEKSVTREQVNEEELVLEDWMTKPFITDITKNKNHI